MRSFRVDERPRERCLQSGPESLSLRECLALIVGTGPKGIGAMGIAQRLLQGDSEEAFFRRFPLASFHSIQGIKGLGPAGQARVLASFEISKRYANFRSLSTSPSVLSEELPREVSGLVFEALRGADVESVGFVPLFAEGTVGEFHFVRQGDQTSVHFDKSEFLRALLYCRAEGFWMFHNHPDGSREVSRQDRKTTREIKALSRALGIHFFGHWIVASSELIKI